MNLSEKQRKEIHIIIEKAKIHECSKANSKVAKAVKEWKAGKKSDIAAYNKIYKKVIRNEHHLVQRYTELEEDSKILRTLAEVFADDIIEMLDFENLEELIQKEVFKIVGVKGY